MSEQERQALVERAIGRLLAIGSRPFRQGDHEEYDHIRLVVVTAAGQ